MAEDIPGDAQLLTYAQLGELLGIEPESAKRRAVRHGWRRVPGNEGRTLVAVPRTALPEHPPVPRTEGGPNEGRPGGHTLDRGGDIPRDTFWPGGGDVQEGNTARPRDAERTLSLALDELRTALQAAELRRAEADERAARAEVRADTAQGLADRRGEELAELRERVGRAEGEAAALREQGASERDLTATRLRKVEAERDRVAARLEDAEAAAGAARTELAEWMAGGPLARALRVLFFRRGQP